jgi:glycerol-3-phosphate acyltransferase PlsY
MAVTFLLIIFGFVLGSIPFGEIVARLRGINIREVGSGNIGATNVLRSLGKVPALLTLIGDIMKGTAAVAVARYIAGDPFLEGIAGLSAITGHTFSLFLRFRGGKGVATAIGVLLLYAPAVGLATVAVWLLVVAVTRYSSLGALVSFAVLPLTMYVFDGIRVKVIIAFLIAGLLILRHAANIERLLKGTESRIGGKG